VLSLLLFAGFVVAAPPGKAVDPAGQVVEGVQKFYRTSQRLTATFRQVSVNATFGNREESAGRVYLKKPGKMRWDYFSARDKNKVSRSQMSDGKMIWAVDVAGKSYFKLRLADSPLPVAVTFLTGKGDLAKEFSAKLLTGSKHGGASDEVLELTPKAPSAQCKTLVLVVDRRHERGQLLRAEFFEVAGRYAVRVQPEGGHGVPRNQSAARPEEVAAPPVV
jgi:outer membrane lipoprotein-sorting protein